MPINDGSNASPAFPAGPPSDLGGAPVGVPTGMIQPATVSESMLIPPPGFPCGGVSGCTSGTGTREVHTQVSSLHLTDPGGSGTAVRAGQWYNNPGSTSWPPNKISPGEVESQSGPAGASTPATDFPASSFFDVFVQVDMPPCGAFMGAFPGGTLYNLMPLIVKNNQVTQFPPKVVYLHDSTSIVPILFLTDNPGFWHHDDILGYFVLVGHGVGFGQGQSDTTQFNSFMSGQSNASCPIAPPSSSGGTASPKPTPTPTASPASKSVKAGSAAGQGVPGTGRR